MGHDNTNYYQIICTEIDSHFHNLDQLNEEVCGCLKWFQEAKAPDFMIADNTENYVSFCQQKSFVPKYS